MTNLIIYYDTQKCHTIVFDCEQMMPSYESFVYVMNFISEFCDLMIFIHFRNQVDCYNCDESVISIILVATPKINYRSRKFMF